MYAVIRTGGKQYRVVNNDVIKVERLAGEAGEMIKLDDVLMLGGDAPRITKQAIGGAAVFAQVLEQGKGEKILVFKKRRRKNSRRLNGHRQFETTLRVIGISEDGTPPPTPELKAKTKAPVADKPARKAAAKVKAPARKAAAGPKPKPKAAAKKAAAKPAGKGKPAAKPKSKE